MGIVLVLAVGGLLTWTYFLHDDLKDKEKQIRTVTNELQRNEAEIKELNYELEYSKDKSAAEREELLKSLEEAKAEREALIENAQVLRDELDAAEEAAIQAGTDATDANAKVEELKGMLKDITAKPAEPAEKKIKIYAEDESAPVIKKEGEGEPARKPLKKY